ncbi:addiction module antitoxin RelB [Arsukibacterium sp. MJ3]|uniref:addiction module protein n=1 Tax=Arsukibacterium sp. MJ3 TaxID=1632859 RepID=UPI0006270E04|nr:addiction module protein [Arsukibacterium sp. MJ3]KKO48654.1 addiction module antitoxin RelB [Arsukibacterium sp. MJ3]
MSEALKYLLENMGQLSTKEKALAAHCLLSAMDSTSDDDVQKEWVSLAEQRSAELELGKVEPMTWTQIKQEL